MHNVIAPFKRRPHPHPSVIRVHIPQHLDDSFVSPPSSPSQRCLRRRQVIAIPQLCLVTCIVNIPRVFSSFTYRPLRYTSNVLLPSPPLCHRVSRALVFNQRRRYSTLHLRLTHILG